MSYLEDKKFRLLGAKKCKKNFSSYEMCEDLIKEDIWVYLLLGYKDDPVEDIT